VVVLQGNDLFSLSLLSLLHIIKIICGTSWDDLWDCWRVAMYLLLQYSINFFAPVILISHTSYQLLRVGPTRHAHSSSPFSLPPLPTQHLSSFSSLHRQHFSPLGRWPLLLYAACGRTGSTCGGRWTCLSLLSAAAGGRIGVDLAPPSTPSSTQCGGGGSSEGRSERRPWIRRSAAAGRQRRPPPSPSYKWIWMFIGSFGQVFGQI
jgi:hypothetical protein